MAENDDSPDAFKANKVLVAEDNPVVRKGLINFLKKWGYKVIEADNGDDAWKHIESNPDLRLAIVDWNLPGLSGMQVCQRLRVRQDAAYIYTIMFSSRKSKEEQILALDGGADDYLVKPCKPSELRARLGVGRRIMETAFRVNAPQPNSTKDKEAGDSPEPGPKENKEKQQGKD